MTLSLRNAIILTGALLNFLLLGLFLIGIYATLTMFQQPDISFNYVMPLVAGNNGDVLLMLLIQLLSLVAVIILYAQFRKTASPEIFFFLLFLLSLGTEGIRILPATAEILAVPAYFSNLVIRALYFSRFLGLFSIFAAGLFSNGMQYQKLSMAFGFILLTAFTLASTMPISDEVLKSGAGIYMFNIFNIMLIMLTIQSLSIINFIIAWIRNNNRDYIWLAGACLLLLSGFQLSLTGGELWLRAAGFLAMCTGTVLFSRRTHEIYLWI